MKKELEWESLEERGKVSRVSILHQALSGHLAIPTQTWQTQFSLIKTQSIYSNSNKQKLSKVLFYAQNCHWLELHLLHIKEIEDKDKFKAAVAQYFRQLPVFTAKEQHQPYSFHTF